MTRSSKSPNAWRKFGLMWSCLLALWLSSWAATSSAADVVTVFAAASLGDALPRVAETAATRGDLRMRPVFGASSALARQILRGAPADVFISANSLWMDEIERAGLTEPGSRRNLLGNRLVIVAADAVPDFGFDRGNGLPSILRPGDRLALGDPDHVPAGLYAKAALRNLGWWQALEGRIVRTANVRAALAFVERGEAAVGIVYESDAFGRRGLNWLGRFPEQTHPPIVYPAAVIVGAGSRADEAMKFLLSDAASAIFRELGFSNPSPN